jgi:hypothetical protein
LIAPPFMMTSQRFLSASGTRAVTNVAAETLGDRVCLFATQAGLGKNPKGAAC